MISFDFRGKNSYEDFGILIEKRPSVSGAQRDVQYIDVQGRKEKLTIDNESYDNITITVECGFIEDDFADKADEIKAWLMGPQDKLIFSDQIDKYYVAQVVNKFDIAQSIASLGQFQVIFNCKPFKRLLYNGKIHKACNGEEITIFNPGTIESLPILKVIGTGNITITLNSTTFTIKDLKDWVIVDSEIVDAYRDTELWNNRMIGDFPVLLPGENKLTYEGNLTAIEITPNTLFI